MSGDLHVAIQSWLGGVTAAGKIGKSVLQPLLHERLIQLGLDVDKEDTKGFLTAGQSVWRSKDDQAIEPTAGRRRIDLVVRDSGKVFALIETESDLDDIREVGVSRRNGHYDVFSIARNSSGHWFHSYKSLERMAAALGYDNGGTTLGLDKVRSDDPRVHNPKSVSAFLVTGSCRPLDRKALRPRLATLRATIITVRDGR